MNPYVIDGPALISFSGGRTSAFMLRRILDAHADTLPHDVHVVFANTGKEREETLAFVLECGERWGVPIAWVEFTPPFHHREVTFESAARDGGPYAALIERRGYLPTPAMSMCTTELKIRPMKRWMLARGYRHWTNVMGIRADEPRRVARLRMPTKERWQRLAPLAVDGVTVEHVTEFWSRQPFDLQLASHEGNCDLCFKKHITKRVAIMAAHPEMAMWWAEQERATGQTFLAATKHRKGEPGYADLNRAASRVRLPVVAEDDASLDCACHD